MHCNGIKLVKSANDNCLYRVVLWRGNHRYRLCEAAQRCGDGSCLSTKLRMSRSDSDNGSYDHFKYYAISKFARCAGQSFMSLLRQCLQVLAIAPSRNCVTFSLPDISYHPTQSHPFVHI